MKRFAPFVAIALSLAVVMPAAAASSGGFKEQFTVERELQLLIQGAGDEVNYGTLDISSLTEPTAYRVVVGSGGFSGYDLTITGSEFTGPGGATIPAEVRRATFGGEDVVPELATSNPEGFPVTTEPLLVAHADPGSLDDLDLVHVSQWIDLGSTPLDGVPDGDYTGTTTWNLSAP